MRSFLESLVRSAAGPGAFSLLLFLSGCGERNQYAPPPPPEVSVAKPLIRDVIDYEESTGSTVAFASVEIRARVEGFIESIHFEDGQMVEKDSLLYIIDRRPFEAKRDAVKADLDSRKANLEQAEIEYKRNQKLMEENAGTDRDLVAAKAARDEAIAAVEAAEADLKNADLNLSWTEVRSPIPGRVGRHRVDVGNLVGSTEPTLLTDVVQYQPVYAYFNISEYDILQYMKDRPPEQNRLNNGKATVSPDTPPAETPPEAADPNEVQSPPESNVDGPVLLMQMANEEGYPHRGVIDYADLQVDRATGTYQLRGIFANDDLKNIIIPGLFVRLRVPIETIENALLVPEAALGMDQQGEYILVVDKDNKVQQRSVKTGSTIDGYRVILEGIGPEDRVVVNGLQRARPGAEVTPQTVNLEPPRFDYESLPTMIGKKTGAGESAATDSEESEARTDAAEELKLENDQVQPAENPETTAETPSPPTEAAIPAESPATPEVETPSESSSENPSSES